MKKMIIMRGPQGVGKSRMCHQLGLEAHRLATDEIRLLIGAPELSASGAWAISQETGAKAWSMFETLAVDRMSRGETLVLDAMFLLPADVRKYVGLAREKGYSCLMLDYTDFPLELSVQQDAARAMEHRVGRSVIEATRKAFDSRPLSESDVDGLKIEKWSAADGDAGLARRAMDWLRVPVADLSTYESVAHIGDLQGCWSVLAGPGGMLERGLDPNVFYIFCGDLLDRGRENGKVLSWFAKEVSPKSNAVLIWGNHEDHLEFWASGMPAVSKEFDLRTRPQLEEAGVSPKDAADVLSRAVDVFPYVWRGQKVVATHAGLPGLPPRSSDGLPQWHWVSKRQYSKGAGGYSDPIDEAFEASQENSTDPWVQVHGHRNAGVPALVNKLSINLEDRVEFGGNLRVAILDKSGWSAIEKPNAIYANWRDRFGGAKPRSKGAKVKTEQGEIVMDDKTKEDAPFALDVKAPIPAWITEANSEPPKLSAATIAAMEAHEGVLKKPMPDRPHVSSLNFTRDVFFDKSWDAVVVKARGLFYNTETGEVASRGYDKFFNVGERPETELQSLKGTLSFPVVGYLKENGFLGNLGYDAARDELMWASKSTTGGDFAKWFKEIFQAEIPADKQAEIKRYLRDAEACMVFEVVDPVRDPHMIDYDKPQLALLDIFHRSEDGRKLGYDDLKKAGKLFGLAPKRRMFEFKDFEGLSNWMQKAWKDLHYKFDGKYIEGVVFEDAAGFQTKCKLPYYGFWKSMRTGAERLARIGGKIEEVQSAIARNPKMASVKSQELDKLRENWEKALKSDSHPMALAFMQWCSGKPRSLLEESSIIALRKAFSEEVGIAPEWMATPWDKFDPTEKEAPKTAKPQAPRPKM